MSAARAGPIPLLADRANALALTPVSRETVDRLERFVALLVTWQKTINLISPSTLPQVWTRHIADSLQLLDLAPDARVWVDLGSGGGFPGVAIACALADRPGAVVHLVESNAKKAAFLREAARVTGAPITVHAVRIEKLVDSWGGHADVVTARALAPLKLLLTLSFPLLTAGAQGLFPKGQDIDAELTEASKYWNINHTLVPSRTDRNGRIVVVRTLERRQAAQH
jgi:16S rRNA (guanine527-N7)-methyltransferase